MKLKHLVLSLLVVILVTLNVNYFKEVIKLCYDEQVNIAIRFIQIIDMFIIGYSIMVLVLLIEKHWNKKMF